MSEVEARKLHDESIVMDMTCPLLEKKDRWKWYAEGGVTVAAPTVYPPNSIKEAVQAVGSWLAYIRSHADSLLLITCVDDIYRAKREGKLGILLHFQNSLGIERDVNMVEVYHRLGVRVIQLAYNEKNHVGNGCEERFDDGLSHFGIKVIREMNRAGIVVDCAHTGEKTTLDALEFSQRPVVVSHGNARAICDNDRNLSDDLIKAIAGQGGLMGLNGFPSFVKPKLQSTVDDLVDHCDHICSLTGSADHVAVGIDFYHGMEGVVTDAEANRREYEEWVALGLWNPRNYPPPPYHYPKEIEHPRLLANLTVALKRRGYSDSDVQKILGGNWIRVLKAHGM